MLSTRSGANEMITTNPDSLVANEDQAQTFLVSALLANDSSDGGALDVVGVTAGTGGTISLENGILTFTPNANFNGDASFSYTVSDGNGGFAVETANVTVGAVNDPVTVNSPTTFGSLISGQSMFLNTCSISDIDATLDPNGIYTIKLTASDGYLLPTTGIGSVYIIIIGDEYGLPPGEPLEVSGTIAEINQWLAGVQYTPIGIGAGATLTLEVTDASFGVVATGSGPATSDTNIITHTIVAADVAPTGADGNISVAQNGLRVLTLADFGFADADGNTLVSVHFDLNSQGAIYLNIGGGDPVDSVIVSSASWGNQLGWVDNPIVPYSVTAADIAAGRVFYRPATGDSGTDTDTIGFALRDDGNANNYSETYYYLSVDVTPAASAAPIVTIPSSYLIYNENGPATLFAKHPVLAGGATVTDSDSADFATGSLAIGIIRNGDAGDVISIVHQGVGSGQIGVSGSDVTYEGVTIGSFTGGTGAIPLVVNLNGNATPLAVQALITAAGYSNTSDYLNPGDRTLSLLLRDGDGGISAFHYVVIDIRTNDDPTDAIDDTASVTEAGVLTGNVFANDLHDGGAAPQVAAINGNGAAVGTQIVLASGALLTVNADGSFNYDPNGAFNHLAQTGLGASNDQGTDSFTYTLTEGDTATVTITINGLYSTPHLILGTLAANILNGTAFADTIDGLFGADTMIGGAGNDTYVVDNENDVVTEISGGGADLVLSSVSYTLASFVERLTLTGTAAINATGTSVGNILIGNSAANILDGRFGADQMTGGGGSDTYIVDSAGDIVTEASNSGTDLVQSSISYTLGNFVEYLKLTGTGSTSGTGNSLNNIMSGNTGNNSLSGGDGNDTLNGGGGADTMIGGNGNDSYVVDNNGDVVTEAAASGIDVVKSEISYTLGSNLENLTLVKGAISGTGNGAANVIMGNPNANLLKGLGGDDIISGGTGNDRIYGGAGNDTLTGGTGADRFDLNSALNASTNVDTIIDFVVVDDTVMLNRGIFSGISADGVLNAAAFCAGTTAADATDRIVYDSATGNIFYDADGNGGDLQVLIAKVGVNTALTNLDFSVYTGPIG